MDSNHPRQLVNRFGSDCYISNSLKTEDRTAETEAPAFKFVKYIYTLTIVYIQF